MTYATLYTRWRYLVLLGTLLLVLVVQPISSGLWAPPLLFDVFLIVATIALLLAFGQDRRKRFFAIALGIPTVLLSGGGHFLATEQDNAAILTGHGLGVVFYFWAAVIIVASLVRTPNLSLDSVFGAICGYLLLGMAWGVLYSMLDTIWPGSFAMGDRLREQVRTEDSHMNLFTYYSFITLTTVGYGDVTPITPLARTCAWLEALTGQFYLAVLVAGLVGALIAKKPDTSEPEKS